jgi:hypothetical protein
VNDIPRTSRNAQLLQGLGKRRILDITERASKFNDTDLRRLARVIHRYLRHTNDPLLYGVGEMRNDLDRLAKKVAGPLPLDNVLVHLSGRNAVVAGESDVEVSLVVAEIEVDFAAIGKHEHFAMFGGSHRSGVYVNVGVNLDHCDSLAQGLEEQAGAGGCSVHD